MKIATPPADIAEDVGEGVSDRAKFTAQVIEWRGPAPFYFVALPALDAAALREAAKQASYGWGCVPVAATIGGVEFRTSLIPRSGSLMLPLKAAVRKALEVVPGDDVTAILRIVSPALDGRG